MELSELYSVAIDDEKAITKVEKVVTYLLEKNDKTDDSHVWQTKEIIEAYKKLKASDPNIVDIPENTIATNLSLLNQTATSRINCRGRKQGYYVSIASSLNSDGSGDDQGEDQQDLETSEDKKKNRDCERKLYPMMKAWLASKTDRVKDISSLRGSTKWRNPDLIGIIFKSLLGQETIELVTVEVKPSMSNWQQFIFEAVSHSMFVHRSYFAFLHPAEEKVPEEMKLYSSQFGVGLVSIEFTKEAWDKFNESGTIPEADDYDIIEIAPAEYHVPNIDLEISFLNGLEVYNLTVLHEYGESSKN